MTASDRASAYNDGHRAGHLDRLMDRRSDYAWYTTLDLNRYSVAYGQGYRDGWNGLNQAEV